MTQDRKTQQTKIMLENFKMLNRIKKSKSSYNIKGVKGESRRAASIAEKLADGLVKGSAPTIVKMGVPI
jgi:hypothetical protein